MASMPGIDRLVVSKVLNHVESGVTKVYDRYSYDPEKRSALDRWAAELQRIVAGKSEERVSAGFLPKESRRSPRVSRSPNRITTKRQRCPAFR